MRVSDTMYYPLRGSFLLALVVHGWRSPDGFAYPRLPKYYPYRGSALYGSIASLTGVATTLRTYISALYLTGIATDIPIGCNGDVSVRGKKYPERGIISITGGKRAKRVPPPEPATHIYLSTPIGVVHSL